jgi:hypothetical protein
MALDSTLRFTTRRALLASGAGGLLALVAQALARPWTVRATDGQPILAGTTNSSTLPTRLDSTGTEGFTATGTAKGLEGWSPGGVGVRALSDAQTGLLGYSGVPTLEQPIPAAPAKTGVFGYANQDADAIGVRGSSPLGTGLQGDGSVGVRALGRTDGFAVHAFNPYSGGVGIYAEAVEPAVRAVGVYAKSAIEAKSFGNGTAVLGFSGAGDLPAAPAKTGVFGYADQDAYAVGVSGASEAGTGVNGRSATTTGVLGVSGTSYGSGPPKTGVFGFATQTNAQGVRGHAPDGTGVAAISNSGSGLSAVSATGFGIVGSSNASAAVYASSNSAALPAVIGRALGGNTAIQGSSGTLAPAHRLKTGVHGYAVQDANARGVIGQSTLGQGVRGEATTGRGVHGQATTGTGVYATATTGTALAVIGKVSLSRSGKIAVAAGATSATKTLAGVTTASMVFALFQTNESGVWVRAAVPAAGSFTVHFNMALPTSASVAYVVLG